MAHKPELSQQQIERIKCWHRQTTDELKRRKSPISVRISQQSLTVLPGVFTPSYPDSKLLSKYVEKEVRKGYRVLDLGSGSGIQGLTAAEKGASVVAVDVLPAAVKNTQINAEKLGVKVNVARSNLFTKVRGRFDLIIFNPPFRWFETKDTVEKSETDKDYKSLRRFLKSAKKFLRKKGKILLVFSNSGDIQYLEDLVEKEGYKIKVLLAKKQKGWLYKVYRLTL